MARRVRHLLPAAAIACAAVALPSVAAAHTRLRASTPAPGDTVADTLGRVRLEFTERVQPAMTSLVLTCGGRPFAEGQPAEVPGSAGRTYELRPPRLLPPGPCSIAWHAAAADGHVVRGTIAFFVAASRPAGAPAMSAQQGPSAGAAAPADSGDDADDEEMEAPWADPGSPLSVAVRWGWFLALLGMIGAPAFHLAVLRRVRTVAEMAPMAERATNGAWHLALGATALSAVTLLARLWLQSVALNGPAEAFGGEALSSLITGTVWGAGWALQALATVAFIVGLMVSRAPHGRSVGWMGVAMAALLLAAVPALSGHASAVEGWTAAAIASDWLHVLGAGAWLGTLASLFLAGLPAAAKAPEGERTAAFARMVGAFSPVALAGASLAGATGVVNSLFHLGALPQLWGTAYGRMLLLKLALLGVVAGFGFWNWRYVQPGLSGPGGAARLRRSAGLELAAGIAVILVTAILVATPPP